MSNSPQVLYIQSSTAEYMKSVHKDDRVGGTVARLWDHPGEGRVAVVVMPEGIDPAGAESITINMPEQPLEFQE